MILFKNQMFLFPRHFQESLIGSLASLPAPGHESEKKPKQTRKWRRPALPIFPLSLYSHFSHRRPTFTPVFPLTFGLCVEEPQKSGRKSEEKCGLGRVYLMKIWSAAPLDGDAIFPLPFLSGAQRKSVKREGRALGKMWRATDEFKLVIFAHSSYSFLCAVTNF